MKKTKTEPVPRDFTGIFGILSLFTIVSVSYMAYVVILGTSGIYPKVMCIPAVIWAAILVIKRFVK